MIRKLYRALLPYAALRHEPHSSSGPTRRLAVEPMEDRNLMTVSFSVSGTTLSIFGDSWKNSVTVNSSGSLLVVKTSSIPQVGYALTPSVVNRNYTAAKIGLVKFYGSSGDDSFVMNAFKNTIAYGGAGNDYLEGGNAVDFFYGDAGNDTLKGYGGNDTLYGGDGNDKLYGMNNNDGLYGGAGTDYLYGGSGVDRFLTYGGSSREDKDSTAIDAVMIFKNGTKTWTSSEIEMIDKGFRLLHQRTGNDNLLENKSGASLTFERGSTDGTTVAVNFSSTRIRFYNSTFKSIDAAALTVIHEMAHNWDSEYSAYQSWLAVAGWRNTAPPASVASQYQRSGDGKWWYLKSASFVFSYARTNPLEDFASSWEGYFRSYYRTEITTNPWGDTGISSAKYSHMSSLFYSLS